MPPESAIEQALSLKKRARRRLVGAIALVILMLIILPNVLKDRSDLHERATIKLTMPADIENQAEVEVANQQNVDPPSDPLISTQGLPEKISSAPSENSSDASASTKLQEQNPSQEPTKVAGNELPIKQEYKKSTENPVKAENKSIQKKSSVESVETKKPHTKETVKVEESKSQRFLIQIGVYSDEANVKELQKKITEAGFSSRTAKLQTLKGEKIRLRVGSFVTREAAAEALKKLQASGLSGMVLIDE